MAFRARLAAPVPEPRQDWPWHEAKWTSLASHLLWGGDRRLEAENYLSSGYGLRLAIQSRAAGWQRFGQLADISQPARVKATLVSPDFGTPFLIANQMFSVRPQVRKWLAIDKLKNADELFVPQGTVLVRRSADVGRSVLTCAHHEKHLISDHFFRIEPHDPIHKGWLYAFIRSVAGRAIMTGAKYGHIINHIEIGHLAAVPVPVVNEERAREFQEQTAEILDLRNRAHRLSLKAEERFESALTPLKVKDWGEQGYTARASAMFAGRRRLEGVFHNPGAAAIGRHLAKHGRGFTTLDDADFDVWVPSRYKRIPAEDGVPYYDSADLLEVCPDVTKRFADCNFGDKYRGRVKKGWLLVPCSGQVYGIIGSVVLAGDSLNNQVVSNHVMRIAARENTKIRTGYLLTALTHPRLGRPLVKALPFGSSVPEIDPAEFAMLQIVRLTAKEETGIADLAEESAALRAQADVKERAMAEAAGRIIEKFIAGKQASFEITTAIDK